MKCSVTGSTIGLRAYAAKLRGVGDDSVLRDLADNLAEETVDLVKEGFELQQDPEGNKWADKVFPDGRSILVQKGHLKGGWHRKQHSASGFIVAPSPATPYARYAQQGTGIYGPNKTPIVPVKKKALKFTPDGYGIVFRRSVKGAKPRRMIPQAGTMPPKWRKRLNEATRDYFRAYFKGH